MRRAAIISSGVVLACVASSFAGAQSMPPTLDKSAYAQGSLLYRNDLRADRDTPESFRMYDRMVGFGRCMAGPGRKLVESALNSQPGSAQERNFVVDAQTRLTGCTYPGMIGIPTLVRGSLSEGLYVRTVKTAPAVEWRREDPAFAAFLGEAATQRALLEPSDRAIVEITDCLAARRPGLADAVIRTSHGSTAENVAMNALFAGAPDCGGPVRPAGLSRTFLRAFLTNSAYRASAWRQAHEAGR